MSDYEFHWDSKTHRDLLGDESSIDFHHGFGEDPDEIEKIIQEELGQLQRRRPRRKK